MSIWMAKPTWSQLEDSAARGSPQNRRFFLISHTIAHSKSWKKKEKKNKPRPGPVYNADLKITRRPWNHWTTETFRDLLAFSKFPTVFAAANLKLLSRAWIWSFPTPWFWIFSTPYFLSTPSKQTFVAWKVLTAIARWKLRFSSAHRRLEILGPQRTCGTSARGLGAGWSLQTFFSAFPTL